MGESWGFRLRAIRNYKKGLDGRELTGKEFGGALGVSLTVISNYENDVRGFDLAFVQKVYEVYHIDPRWFFGLIDRIEDADLTKQPHKGISSTENLAREIIELRRVVMPAKDFDPLAHRVQVKPELRKLVQMVAGLEDHAIHRVQALVFGYLQRDEEVAEATEEPRERAEASG